MFFVFSMCCVRKRCNANTSLISGKDDGDKNTSDDGVFFRSGSLQVSDVIIPTSVS